MLLGSMLAGMAFANAPVAAVHALAYPIGALFHVPHGLSNAMVLPHVVRFNAPTAEELYAELANIIMPGAQGSAAQKTEVLVGALATWPRASASTRVWRPLASATTTCQSSPKTRSSRRGS